MNKDQAKGAAKDAAGKVQRKFGEAIGSEKQQVKGLGKQVEGKAQKAVGNAKEDIKDAAKRSRW
ncbi:MAG: CsbD family protein [Sulfuricaulis sp.]|nr:CsbD family protein [Sulfuricaulis sp.]